MIKNIDILFYSLLPGAAELAVRTCTASGNSGWEGNFKRIQRERNIVCGCIALTAISTIGAAMTCPPLVLGAVSTVGVCLTRFSVIRLWNATYFLRNPDQDFRDPFIRGASWKVRRGPSGLLWFNLDCPGSSESGTDKHYFSRNGINFSKKVF